MPSEGRNRPVFSLILCSRSDEYQGNSLWRTETALNYLGQTVAELSRQNDVECLLVDWGSPENRKLRDVLRLSSDAARIVSFLYISPDVAKREQGDSPFPEVIALNAAARRAKGDYIGRIDQDTLVGKHFLEVLFWLYEGRRLVTPLDRAMLLSNRKRISVRFTKHSPSLWAVTQFVKKFSRFLPLMDPLPPHLFYQAYVGIWMLHRDVWASCGGYDESFIYMDWQEVDFMLRLSPECHLVNLGELTDHDMYHLDHGPARVPWSSQRNRKTNPVRDTARLPPVRNPNGADWGLNHYDIPLEPGVATAAVDTAIRNPSPLQGVGFVAFSIGTFLQVQFDNLIIWARPPFLKVGQKIRVIFEVIDGQAVGRWPRLLRDRWNRPEPAVAPVEGLKPEKR